MQKACRRSKEKRIRGASGGIHLEGKRTTRTAEANQVSKALSTISKIEPITKFVLNNLNILYTNADCFNNKKNDLEVLLQSLNNKPDIIVINEVNPKKMVKGLQESEFN